MNLQILSNFNAFLKTICSVLVFNYFFFGLFEYPKLQDKYCREHYDIAESTMTMTRKTRKKVGLFKDRLKSNIQLDPT